MSMARHDLGARFDALLQPERFKDYGPNGLQVEGKRSDIILTEKLDFGSDWERVRFRPAEATPE